MKTPFLSKVVAFTFILGLLGTGLAFSGAPNKSKVNDVLRSKVKEKVTRDFSREENLSGIVEFSFTVKEDGSINYKKFLSSTPEIGEYVKKKLSDIDLKNEYKDLTSTYLIRLTFERKQ